MEIKRDENNPILKPEASSPWENYAVFNGCPVKVGDEYHLLYRAMGDEVTIDDKRLRLSVIGDAVSDNGVKFAKRRELIRPGFEWDKFGCEDPRVTHLEGEYYIFYTALADYPPSATSIRVGMAVTTDFQTMRKQHLVTPFNAKAMALFPQKVNGQYAAILTVNTDLPPAKIAIATFDNLEDLVNPHYWQTWYQTLPDHVVPLQRMNHDQVEVGAPPLLLDDGWLLIYSYIKNYSAGKPEFRIEAAVLDKDDPRRFIGRLEKPILEPMAEYESEGRVREVVFSSGALIEDDRLRIYYGAADTTCDLVSVSLPELKKNIRHHAHGLPRLTRVPDPIIKPIGDHSWEAKATFNPGVFYAGGRIHIVYRAMSFENTSVLGHAESIDGFQIDKRLDEPIYLPKTEAESKKKSFANSGVEDPRLTVVENTLYMCYTAYNGVDSPRVALTSISLDDFLNHRWSWRPPVLISKAGIDDKDACIMPEKLDEKYVIFHRIGRNIVFDYADTLELDGTVFFEGSHQIFIREKLWDGERIGICAPPIKTDVGWLLFYHGRSKVDQEYRVGVMLLDTKHPSIVLARSPYPLLEPEMPYERRGWVNNVVFPCGVVLHKGTVFVYYGAADQVTGVATIPLNILLGYLEEIKNPSPMVQEVPG